MTGAAVLDGLERLRRDYSVKVIGRFAVTYWIEPERIIRVVRILRIRGG